MKTKIKFIFIILCFFKIGQNILFGWPTNAPQKVCGSFGTYEDMGGKYFHNGIDIYGTGDSTQCIAIEQMTFRYCWRQGRTNSYNLAATFDSSHIDVIYAHINPLSSGINILTLTNGNTIPAGAAFAVIASKADAGTTFDHLHFTLCSDWNNSIPTSIDPLLENLTGNNNPGGNKPEIGPIYFKRPWFGAYFKKSVDKALFNKTDIIAQITDDMGHKESSSSVSDNDVWPSAENRFTGITSSPHKIEWKIKDNNNNAVITEDFTMPTNPDNGLIVNWYTSSEHSKHAYDNPEYFFLHNLTKFQADRSWNTKLKKSATNWWESTDSTNPDPSNSDGPKYPDGNYSLEVTGEDAGGNKTDPPKKVDFVIDNFLPFIIWVKAVRG